jgi:predicted phage tail protein
MSTVAIMCVAQRWCYAMKVVKLYGALRKFVGGQCRFELDVATPAEAMKCLCVNFPGLQQWLIDSEQHGMAFRATVGRERIHDDDMSVAVLPWSDREVFSIAPVVVGAGDGFGQIAAGIGLVALAIVLGPAAGGFLGLGAGLGGATGAGAAVSMGLVGGAFANAIGLVGATMILTGVAQLISPQPTMSGLERGREAARLESFSFSGIVNTSQQGLPVPIIYGRAFAGSAVLSAGLDTDQLQ